MGAEAKAAKELHDKAEAKKASDAKAEKEAMDKRLAEESSTNWAVIGLAAAAVAGGVWYYMKNVKK
jgi:hypothetical protein